MALFIVSFVITSHFEEALFLVERIVQLGEGVAELETGYVTFETFHGSRSPGFGLGQRRNVARVVVQECRLDQGRLEELGEQEIDQFAACSIWVRRFIGMFGYDRLEKGLGVGVFGNVDGAGFEDSLAHFEPPPGRA